jgi:hypothetical protein
MGRDFHKYRSRNVGARITFPCVTPDDIPNVAARAQKAVG